MVAVLAIPVLSFSVLAGCTAQEPQVPLGGSQRPSASTSAGPTFATSDPVEALRGWLEAIYHAQRALNPNHPGLTKYGQGPALADIRKRIASFRTQGVRRDKPHAIGQPQVTSAGTVLGKQVREVTVCITAPPDDFVDVKTGKPRAPKERLRTGAISSQFIATVVLMPDGWHVDGNLLEDVDTCAFSG